MTPNETLVALRMAEEAACMCDREADRQSAYEGSVRDPGLKATHAATAYTLIAVAQRIRDLKEPILLGAALPIAADHTPRRLLGPLLDLVVYDEGFQAALQDYHHNGGSSMRVARAALKAIGEE